MLVRSVRLGDDAIRYCTVLLALTLLGAAELYPAVDLAKVSSGSWIRPRAEVTGKVTLVKREDDGDLHFRLENGFGAFIVCEIIPELKLAAPKVGDSVVVRGVVRYDGEHKWWELHPVTSWSKK